MVTDNTGVSQSITFMKYLYLDDDVLMKEEDLMLRRMDVHVDVVRSDLQGEVHEW